MSVAQSVGYEYIVGLPRGDYMVWKWVIATPLILFMIALAVGGHSGRVKANQCCTPTNNAADGRLNQSS
jgi:hypothetical protein